MHDFRKFWFGQTVSLVGSEISIIALPLTAILFLEATPRQIGLLSAATFAPYILVTLFAGVWIDQHRRRPVMIAADLGRGMLMGLIPLLAWLGILRIEFLYGIVFLVGILNVLFELGYQSYLPTLVGKTRLPESNSKLFSSASAAAIGGPGLAGALVQGFTAPFAMVVDAVSFFVSAVALGFIQKSETRPTVAEKQNLWREIREGLEVLLKNPYLRAFVGEASIYNVCYTSFVAMFILYATRELGLNAATIGLIFAIGSAGALVGSLVAVLVARRIGMGMTIVGGCWLACFSPIAIPFSSNAVIIMTAFFLIGMGTTLTVVHTVSVRLAIIPTTMHGRVNASYRFIAQAPVPIWAFVSGLLAEVIGLQGILIVCGIGLMVSWLAMLTAPVAALRDTPPAIGGELMLAEGVAA